MFWFDLYGHALEWLQIESIFTLMARITYQGTQGLGAHGCSGANIPGKTISGISGIAAITIYQARILLLNTQCNRGLVRLKHLNSFVILSMDFHSYSTRHSSSP